MYDCNLDSVLQSHPVPPSHLAQEINTLIIFLESNYTMIFYISINKNT